MKAASGIKTTDLKPKLDVIKKMFPQKLSEAEPNKS